MMVKMTKKGWKMSITVSAMTVVAVCGGQGCRLGLQQHGGDDDGYAIWHPARGRK